jgi:hypothetical protein
MLISELLAALSSFADARGRARLCINAQAVGIIQLNQPVGQNIRRAGLPALAPPAVPRPALLRVMRMMRVVVVATMMMPVMRRVRKAGTRKQ